MQVYRSLDLSTFDKIIYVSATHWLTEDLHELEDELSAASASLTYDINEAEIILSKVQSKMRNKLDLRSKGLYTEEAVPGNEAAPLTTPPPSRKRKRHKTFGKQTHENTIVIDSSTESEDETGRHRASPSSSQIAENGFVQVIKVDWFTDSQKAGHALPLTKYVTYRGRRIEHQDGTAEVASTQMTVRGSSNLTASSSPASSQRITAENILERAQQDPPASSSKYDRFGRRKFGLHTPSANPSSWEAGHRTSAKYTHLLQENTTEHEGGDSDDMPEPPEWVKEGLLYACQRSTPKNNSNDAFINLLKKIKLARLLTNDEIGVRAYSTSIASLAAYTPKISHPREIIRLPGCDQKIANLWIEWKNTGRIQAVDDLEHDRDLKVLRTLYDIWGCGSTTARDFYFNKGWTDLDDITEHGWDHLSRVQKIGVKFYDEFLDLIPRGEVEEIGDVIRRHGVKVRDEKVQLMIVGGYRRGKEASGDVDVIVSHPDEQETAHLVEDIVDSLEDEGWITHTLTISLNSTKRDQQTLPFREGGGGHGFDTLDKALVVWQNPVWPTKGKDLAENAKAKNPNIHRRVDIIVSPWRTVGCAVVGWSGGTTFERDLRRYAKNVKSWKFDSSGVRDRRSGEVLDIEGYHGWKGQEGAGHRAKTMEEAERRVFHGFGLTYRPPTERCTG